jgi:hypothetical protein
VKLLDHAWLRGEAARGGDQRSVLCRRDSRIRSIIFKCLLLIRMSSVSRGALLDVLERRVDENKFPWFSAFIL